MTLSTLAACPALMMQFPPRGVLLVFRRDELLPLALKHSVLARPSGRFFSCYSSHPCAGSSPGQLEGPPFQSLPMPSRNSCNSATSSSAAHCHPQVAVFRFFPPGGHFCLSSCAENHPNRHVRIRSTLGAA